MKSHIYERIADILTGYYVFQGRLPETDERFSTLVYTKVEYLFSDSIDSTGKLLRTESYCFSGTYSFADGRTVVIYKLGPDYKEAINTVWPYLDKSEKTELMAEVLGNHG